MAPLRTAIRCLFTVGVLAAPWTAFAQQGWTGTVTNLSALGTADGNVIAPAVQADAHGNAYAVWAQRGVSTWTIQAARYDAAAETWSGAVNLSAARAGRPRSRTHD